jgi:hypothetical protein
MTDLLDTLPGPAGLFFRTGELSSAGWQLEHAARARLERWCAFCGQSACYGYGVTLASEGVWSCADADCQALAEARAASPLPQAAE